MDEPRRIDRIIDEAMTETLGPAGFEFYAELVRQTQENRQRIECEVRARIQTVLSEVFGELTGIHTPPEQLELAARLEANRRIQAELGRRISGEELAFRERLERLYAWSEEQKQKGCENCGG